MNSPSVADYYASLPGNSTSAISISVEVRECIVGETLLSTGECQECPPGFYLLETAPGEGSCLVCHPNAVCLSGAKIYPAAGFWRSSNTSENFIACMNPEACLGYVDDDTSPLGDCTDGYQGMLCSECSLGYTKTGDWECTECPHLAAHIFGLIFLVGIPVLILLWIVRSAILNAFGKRDMSGVYLRMLTSHIQILLLIASYDLEWHQNLL